MKNKRNCLLLNHWLATAFIDLFVDVFHVILSLRKTSQRFSIYEIILKQN